MNITIVRARVVTFPRGYAGFAPSQITELACSESWFQVPVRAWVRENRRASSQDHFLLSSGARLGHKADGDRIGHEVLELAAPNRWWNEIALEVARMDDLKRPVRRHAQWTLKTAPEWMSKRRRA